jgi:hypothetical protein
LNDFMYLPKQNKINADIKIFPLDSTKVIHIGSGRFRVIVISCNRLHFFTNIFLNIRMVRLYTDWNLFYM